MTDATTYDRFDAAFRSISAYAILRDGKPVGRLVLKHGAAVKAYLQLWGNSMAIGSAGGGGYDRATAAVQSAACKLRNDGSNHDEDAADALVRVRSALNNGRDGDTWTRKLEDAGFVLALVIG